ncbi:hypothetical protein BDN72DRAFT_90461 [Pluteus cervinus]|uniref:Uncharacterized protein n=1 Tax=Pluteus cervinus TaxID=181527 RepID=A0ACD3ANQ9_9AGAR|nr:hypothetical protein BDN72DRAFT_90461 [Pluteus cervinus]
MAVDVTQEEKEIWIPYPLRAWFWIPFVLLLALGAIALEVALKLTKKNNGWPTGDGFEQAGILHYVYTLPPVAIAAFIVAMWTWTDIEIKKLQPYVDLVHGDSPPHRSLLLDYTRSNNFLVWTTATSNKHYLVAIASLMVVLSLSFQPLAAALLVVRDTYWQEPDVIMNSLAAVGLNQNLQFTDLTSFLTAAGFAAASVLYRLDTPPFILGQYTVAPFELPQNIAENGTIFANTTALKSDAGCTAISVNMTELEDGSDGWVNSMNYNGCSLSWQVDKNATTLFGTDTPNCVNPVPPQFSPVVFWFFTYAPSAKASATICYPTFTLWDVNVNVDLATGNLTKVRELRPFTSNSNFSMFSGNVTGPPLNGRAYNGIQFNLTNPDRFVLAREDATQLQMPAAVYQAAVQSPEGLIASFDAGRFVDLSNKVYSMYMTLIAREVYFLPTTQPMTLQVTTIQKRLWLGDTAVHLLATGMLLLSFFATIVQVYHRDDRRNLRLKHEPGTIAGAVSIGGQTGMGELLAGRQRAKDMNEALHDKKFRIDPRTMKIVMEGENGYEYAASPGDRRKSIFASLQNQNLGRRFSFRPSGPLLSPNQPAS